MKSHIKAFAAVALPVLITAGLVAAIIFSAIPSCFSSLDFSAVFYYVCYKSPTDSMSAASVSGVVHSYGGAGYIVENEGEYFVTIACYYEEKDALEVEKNLKSKGLSCNVVEVKREKISLPPSARAKAESFKGTLNTLVSLSRMCYELANGMDGGGGFTGRGGNQDEAKSVLAEVETGLNGLLRGNADNCFSAELDALIAECEDVSSGYVFSYDVRRLQVAICDSIIHVRLY